MTDRSRSLNYENAGYISGKMVNDLSPRKTMIVLVIVVGCFAVLWPKVFYPMLVGTANSRIKPSSIDRTQGCCDVIYEKDVATIKVMSEICSTIIKKDDEGGPISNKELLQRCQSLILETCGIDITVVLQEQVRLGHTTRQILEEIRSLNGSLCLKYNFGVAPWKLGVPHRVTVKVSPSSSIRQERPLHLRSEMVHPAFRERGRAIPQADFAPTKPAPPSRLIPKVIEGRPGPIPGMRPTIGGAGHVVPPPKQGGTSMGLIMPIYTIGIVIFFTYTVMKIVFKKQPEVLYPPINPDPHFRREVFEADRGHLGTRTKEGGSKLVVNAMSALLDEVDLELSSRRKTSEVIQEDVVANGSLLNQEDDQSSVRVLGMETTASRENGQKWTRSGSPVLPVAHPPRPESPPQEIFLEGSLPPQSHLLVTDSATEAQKIDAEEDPAVVLAGKMTLSVISLDSSENGTDESSNCSKKNEERSSSNVSEEFEKIDIEQLEEENIAGTENANLLELLKESEKSEEFVKREAEECIQQVLPFEESSLSYGEEQKTPNQITAAVTDDFKIDIVDKETSVQEEPSSNVKDVDNTTKSELTQPPHTYSIENLIEDSVNAVAEHIQDKQKELDALILKTEEELAHTTDFVDSKIEQIQRDLVKIEQEQGPIQITEIDSIKPLEETPITDIVDQKQAVEEIQEVARAQDVIDDIKRELGTLSTTKESEESEKLKDVATPEEIPQEKHDIKEIIENIKEELIIEELIIPSVKESDEHQKQETVEEIIDVKEEPVKEQLDQSKETVVQSQNLLMGGINIPDVLQKDTKEMSSSVIDSLSRELQPESSDIKKQVEDKTDITDATKEIILESVINPELGEPVEIEGEDYVLESDNEEDEDEIENEILNKREMTDSQSQEAVVLDKEDSEKQHEDIEEEYEEDDDEEEYDEEVEEEDGEEVDQEIVEYISDEEEEEVEVDEEEEEDLDGLENEKVISHV